MVDFADIPALAVIAHRNGGFLAPEGTMAGLRHTAALGCVLDAGDFRTTRDGAVVSMHDPTVGRTTSLSGDVADFTLAGLVRGDIVDCSTWFGGGWPDTRIVTLDEVLGEFGGRYPIVVEPKDPTAAARVAQMVDERGIGSSVCVDGGDLALVTPSTSVGAYGMLNMGASTFNAKDIPTFVAELQAAGVGYISVHHANPDLVKLQQCAQAGIRVIIYGVERHSDRAVYDGVDLWGISCLDPLYLGTSYQQTSVSWPKSGTYGPGHLDAANSSSPTRRGSFHDGRWEPTVEATTSMILVGEICPITAATYTLTVPITVEEAGSDSSRWAGIVVCAVNDRGWVDQQAASGRDGYFINVRRSGQIQLWRITGGVATFLASATGPAIPEAGTLTVTVAVTPTGITVGRSDGGPSVVSADTTYRGGYVHLGRGALSAGFRCSFGEVAVS